jgi:hypothetical protein
MKNKDNYDKIICKLKPPKNTYLLLFRIIHSYKLLELIDYKKGKIIIK